jgi:hypothetical protein
MRNEYFLCGVKSLKEFDLCFGSDINVATKTNDLFNNYQKVKYGQ